MLFLFLLMLLLLHKSCVFRLPFLGSLFLKFFILLPMNQIFFHVNLLVTIVFIF